MHISMTDSFVESLAALSPSDGKRVASFLDKMLHAANATSLRPEIVHEAGDRAVRSFKVTHDLRAIAHVDGEDTVLMFVGRHDTAYAWAEKRCIECHPVTGELQIVADPDESERALASSVAVAQASRIAGGHPPAAGLFDSHPDDYLLSLGVPVSWLPTVRMIYNEDMLLAVAPDLPAPVAERLVRLATGEELGPICTSSECMDSGSLAVVTAGHGRSCRVEDDEDLCRLLDRIGIDGLSDA